MSSPQHVVQAARRVTILAAALDQARAHRDQAIRDVLKNGATVPDIIQASGLVRSHVYQIKGK